MSEIRTFVGEHLMCLKIKKQRANRQVQISDIYCTFYSGLYVLKYVFLLLVISDIDRSVVISLDRNLFHLLHQKKQSKGWAPGTTVEDKFQEIDP